MLPDRVSNPGPLTYKSGVLPIALRGPTCLKGPLKQQQQHKFNFGYSLTELKLPVKDGKQCWL